MRMMTRMAIRGMIRIWATMMAAEGLPTPVVEATGARVGEEVGREEKTTGTEEGKERRR
jgi:hypothetical protein